VNFKNIEFNHSGSSRLSAGQSLTDGAVLPGDVKGMIASEKSRAKLNPKIEVAPKRRIE
jgi:hypothetical protein